MMLNPAFATDDLKYCRAQRTAGQPWWGCLGILKKKVQVFGVGGSDEEVEVVGLHTTYLWIAQCKQPQLLADAELFL